MQFIFVECLVIILHGVNHGHRHFVFGIEDLLPSLIARRWVGRQTLWWHRLKAIHFSWLGPELLVCCLAHRVSTGVFLLLRVSVSYSVPRDPDDHRRAAH